MPGGSTSAIPVGTQFSPALIDLPEFLKAVIAHSGDKAAIQEAIFAPPVHLRRHSIPSSRRAAALPLEAAAQYGLLTPQTYEATELAQELIKLQGAVLYDRFAQHILLQCKGLQVIQAIEQMQLNEAHGSSSVSITADSLARYLTESGATRWRTQRPDQYDAHVSCQGRSISILYGPCLEHQPSSSQRTAWNR